MADYFDSKTLLTRGINKLKFNKISTPEIDARILLTHATKSKEIIYMHNEFCVSRKHKQDFCKYLEERIGGKPVSRIIGVRNFWKNDFSINNYTLDPRPDSEIIIDVAIKSKKSQKSLVQTLDLGAGSGCLGLSIIDEIKNSSLLSLDTCKNALKQVDVNAKKLKLRNKLYCTRINWFEKGWVKKIQSITFNEKLFLKTNFDIIVCNPPYIRSSDINKLEIEVKNYDPLKSLDGGIDGVQSYRAIFSGIKELLSKDGLCLFEIGFDMLESVKALLKEFDLKLIKIHKDLRGCDRVLEIR